MIRRHWPSAWTWLCTLFSASTGVPGRTISWKWIGRKCSATMCSGEVGIRWWMSATRPASEFSMGIIARCARPSVTAAKASSKVGQGSGVQSG